MKDINFFSEYIQNRKRKGKKTSIVTFAIIITLCTSIGFYAYNNRKIEFLESELELLKIDMSSEDMKEGLNKYKNIEDKTKLLNMYHSNLIEVISKIDKVYNVNSFIINDIRNVMPKKMFISSINANSEGIYIQGITVNRVLIAEFQYNLRNLEEFSDVHVNVISGEHEGTENLVFTAKCYFEDVTKDEAE